MVTIQTDITRLLGMNNNSICGACSSNPHSGIQTPIVLAPMAGVSGGALASEVSLAGGFGFLAPGEAWPLPTQWYMN